MTEREEVPKARVGQGRFRKLLLDLWRARCAVTGVELPAILVAAHIKPWRCATNAERLNPHNGLLVLPQYDKLYDRGLISFEDGGGILVSPAMPKDKFELLGVREDAKLASVTREQQPFLSFHRDRVFISHDAQN